MALKEYKPGSAFTGVDRAHVRRVVARLARAAAREGGRAERALHRAGRHRLRPDGLLRQPDQDAEHRCAGRQRPALQQHAHHGAVLADALVHPDRAQPPLERDVLHHRRLHRLSRRQRQHPVRERLALGDPAAEGLQHLRARQVAPDARRSDLGGRPVRPLAAGPRLRALLRLPRRRHPPVLPGAGLRQPRVEPEKTPEEGYHLTEDLADKAISFIADAKQVAPNKPFFMYFCPGAGSRAAPRAEGMGRQVQGPVRRRLGRLPREDVRAPEGAGHHPEGRRALAPRPRRAGLGHALGRREEALRPHDGSVRRLPRPTPTTTTAGCSSS